MAKRSRRSAMGSVREMAPGVWRVRLELPRGSDGKRRTLSKNVRGSRREAELQLARFILQSGRGGSVLRNLTVYEFMLEAWLPMKSGDVRARTIHGYRQLIENHIQAHFADVHLRDVIAYVIKERLGRIEAPGARHKVHGLLRQGLRFAVEEGLLEVDPMPSVPVPRLPRKSAQAETMDVYTLQEVRLLLDYFRGDPIEAAVLLAVSCGLRRSEVCALDWTDVKLPVGGTGEVRIRRSYHGTQGFAEPKSRRSARVVSIPTFATARLLEIRGPAIILGPVLVAERGGRMSPTSLTGRWRLMMGERAGSDGAPRYESPVRYLPLKNLRHTHATLTLAAGAAVVDVSRRLGHSSVTVTDQFYLRPGRDADERAADAFGDAISGDGSGHIGTQRHA